LDNNRLRDLDSLLPALQHFQYLERLDFSRNPVDTEANYRLRVIYHMPQLQVREKR